MEIISMKKKGNERKGCWTIVQKPETISVRSVYCRSPVTHNSTNWIKHMYTTSVVGNLISGWTGFKLSDFFLVQVKTYFLITCLHEHATVQKTMDIEYIDCKLWQQFVCSVIWCPAIGSEKQSKSNWMKEIWTL